MALDLGSAQQGFYVLTQPEGAGCRSYHFRVTRDDGSVSRYPQVGQLRTFNEGGCTENYVP
jgi:hypothetical protein